MFELIINKQKENKLIELVEDGNLVEFYQENDKEERKEGNIYIGVVKDVLQGMQSAFVDIGTERNSFIHLKDILPKIDETKEDKEIKKDISEVIKKGQKLLVQVKKDSNDKKGARVSTHISLASKYIIFTPNTDIITISQKIEDKKEQERLKKLVKANITNGNGAIIRTFAKGKEQEVIEDIKKQENKWKKIQKKFIELTKENNKNKERLIFKNENIIEKMLTDLTDEKIKKIIVNNKEDYKDIEKIIKENKELQKITLEIREDSLDNIYNIEKQIEKANNRKVWLKCGAFIAIDKTEALTAIDVNTGKFTGNKELEETIFKVNYEATLEIVKQLRIRDIGGIIIIDYIDMKDEKNKETIEKLLRSEIKKDRTKVQVEGFTKLDLMELTRKHICSHKE